MVWTGVILCMQSMDKIPTGGFLLTWVNFNPSMDK